MKRASLYRPGMNCTICGQVMTDCEHITNAMPTVDHSVPKSIGGTGDQMVCKRCNQLKAASRPTATLYRVIKFARLMPLAGYSVINVQQKYDATQGEHYFIRLNDGTVLLYLAGDIDLQYHCPDTMTRFRFVKMMPHVWNLFRRCVICE